MPQLTLAQVRPRRLYPAGAFAALVFPECDAAEAKVRTHLWRANGKVAMVSVATPGGPRWRVRGSELLRCAALRAAEREGGAA